MVTITDDEKSSSENDEVAFHLKQVLQRKKMKNRQQSVSNSNRMEAELLATKNKEEKGDEN